MVRSATQLSMVGDFDENFQKFDVCNVISTLAYCFFKLLSSLVRFIPRCGDAITGLEMKSDLYLSHILERCEAFWVPRSPIRVHGRRLCKQLSTQKTKISPFLQTSFLTICKHHQTIQPGALRNHQQEQQQGPPRKRNPRKCLFNVCLRIRVWSA